MAEGERTGDGQDTELEAKIEGIIERVLARQTPARQRTMVGRAKKGGVAAVGGAWGLHPNSGCQTFRWSFGGKHCWVVLSLKY